MRRNADRTVWVLLASLLFGLLAAIAPAAMAQASKPAAPAQAEEKKQGTGVVPPGVKLAPRMPAAGPARPFHFPQAATKTLANGLRVFVITDHRQPAVAARLVLTGAGYTQDPEGLAGVAEMTESMLTQGTEKRSAQEIAQAIDFVGGSLRAQAAPDSTYVTVSVVKKDIDLGMDLLSDVVLHPSFKKEELDRQQQQALSGLEVGYSDASYLATAVFPRIVYGASPYGLPGDGTPDSVRKFDRDALVHFHDTYYAPNGALLAFAGDITPAVAFVAAEKYFGGWPKKDLPAARMAVPEPSSGLRIVVVDKPDAVQTQIRVGRLGIARNNPDYIPLYVTNRIFGGGYNSRLNTEVRINKGLTYGANSVFASNKFAGVFAAGTSTRTEATVEATKLIVDLIARMSNGEVTPAELNFARDYLAGVYPIQSETAEQVADRVLTVAEFGLPEDYNETYPQRIREVDAAAVKKMAGHYFDAKNLDLVLVGNASKFRDDLKKAFPTAKYEELPADQLDLLSPNLRKAAKAAPAATPESLERGRAILLAAAKAAGGDAIGKIDSIELSSTGSSTGPGGQEITTDLKLTVAYPDRIRLEQKLPFGTVVLGFDGKSGWLVSPQGAMDLPPNFFGELQRGIALAGAVGLYREALAGKIEAQFIGEEEIEGKKTVGVQWNAPFGEVKLYFDPETHLLVAARFRQLTQQGPTDAEQRWSDYKSVEGLQLAHASTVFHEGAKFSSSTLKEVKLNTKPDAAIFEKPKQ